MSARLDFEQVYSNAGNFERAKVPGGWLVREVMDVCKDMSQHGRGIMENGYEWRTALVFVPDVGHTWGFAPALYALTCTVPPEGWYCTRQAGHDGPCAAHPAKEA